MEQSAFSKTHRNLEIWKRGRGLVKVIYELTSSFPPEERYGLTQQMRRCAVSFPSNIAEGHARAGTKEFLQFLSIAQGSLAELETQLYLASDLSYISDVEELMDEVNQLERMVYNLRMKLSA